MAIPPLAEFPRVCIGNGFAMMEVGPFRATLAHRHKLTPETTKSIKPVQLVTIKPNRPLRMKPEEP